MDSTQRIPGDRSPLDEFSARAKTSALVRGFDMDSNGLPLPMHIFEWDRGVSNGEGFERGEVKSINGLDILGIPDVRVIFAPRDEPIPEIANGLLSLFDKFSIPSQFVEESLQNVSQSFGVQKKEGDSRYTWFHLLSKDISVRTRHGRRQIVPLTSDVANGHLDDQGQYNFSWVKPGVVLKVDGDSSSSPLFRRSTSNSNDSTTTIVDCAGKVSLLCFGAPIQFLPRFRRLAKTKSCEEILEDPYLLMEAVFEEMHKFMDQVVWQVADIFGEIETETLGSASSPVKAEEKINFTSLHNLLKHTIYLRENCEAALYTLDSLSAEHETYIRDAPTSLQLSTSQAFSYRRTMFQSTQRQLGSLDERMKNIVQLSFHLATQRDSRIMQSEALSMKMIAVVTLIFVPLGTVAGVFGTQFITLDDNSPQKIMVSQDFWLLWVIAVPLTLLVVIIWRVWYRDERAQLQGEMLRRGDGERGYMGWKSLKDSINARRKKRGMARIEKQEECVTTQ